LDIKFDRKKFYDIIVNTDKYLNGNEDARAFLRHNQELEQHWYDSLKKGDPDYSVYDDVYYLADCFICWKRYSRKYLKEIINPKSLGKKVKGEWIDLQSIKEYMSTPEKIADIGCGIGYSSAALTEMFPYSNIIGTNLRETKQWKVCEYLANEQGFDLTETVQQVGKVDMVFASEYFEHFLTPVEHLIEVMHNCEPRYILFANTFGSKSIGHFDTYYHDSTPYTGREISRLFSKMLRKFGYKKVKTNCWNNRPNFYEL